MAAKKNTKKTGLYANIHAKQERIKHGSGEHMREAGSEGAPSDEAFKAAAKPKKAEHAEKSSAGDKKSSKSSK